MYCGGKNQKPKLQWSSKIGREKHEKCEKAILQSRRVCKKKDLISSNDRSHLSKHLAFISLQIHHIKQCSTSLQKYILRCRLNLPRLKQLNYLKRHNPLKSKQTQPKDHISKAIGQWRRRWSTDCPHFLHM